MSQNEKQQVIKAIGELGRRVTTADVATKTGLPVLKVQSLLNVVAADTGGHMQVGTAGDIVYAFSPGFSNTYLAKGIEAVLQAASAKVLAVLFYLLRISFGIALILSLVIVIVLIVVITLIMQQSSGNDRGRDDGFDLGGIFDGGFHFSFWDWMILRDILWWNAYSSPTPVRYDYSRPTVRTRQRSNFLLNCFSFLFGDGDPNEGLDEKRWQLIAHVIKRNKNVLTAEQLAPYTGADPKNEDGVLPVLVRFNGKPEVTENGNIIYVFESMQSVAANQNIDAPPYLKEFEWKFSNVPQGDLMPVYIVSGLNLGGAMYLWHLVQLPNDAAILAQRGAEQGGQDAANSAIAASSSALYTAAMVHHSLVPLVACLVGYGAAFLAVPSIRHLINVLRNQRIEARNMQRLRYSQMLANPDPDTAAKLKQASEYRLGDRKISEKDVVYTTEKDSLDQADELSEKFDHLEQSFKLPSATPTSKDPAPPDPDAEDAGTIIDIKTRKKQSKPISTDPASDEFDASP